ncbi:MAG: T9SS type A sorting domain-containing protein, partial [Flavobacteriaceae bacterium]|nr:T9SS type A sorting domain-containing protein [Flavobacteriaceae bacterium]
NSMYYKYGQDSFDSRQMPLLSGANQKKGVGINPNGKSHVIFKNFQVKGYLRGIRGKANNTVFDNFLVEGGDDPANKYNGAAIILMSNKAPDSSSKNNRFTNGITINGGVAGITIYGEHTLIENCKVYANIKTGTGSTDYYILVHGSNNIVRNSYAEKVVKMGHGGHGIGIKDEYYPSEYNLIEKCVVKKISNAYFVRWALTKYNVIKDCKSIGSGKIKDSQEGGGIVIFNGADYNIFERMEISNVAFGVYFRLNNEGGNATSIGSNNIIRNSIFNKAYYGIIAINVSNKVMSINDNNFMNCVFNDMNSLMKIYKKTDVKLANNKFTNCTFSNIKNIKPSSSYSYDWNTKNDFLFEYCNFYKGFSKPSGNKNSSFNPEFEDISGGNFKLKSGSPLIDKGKKLDDSYSDFNRNPRPQGASNDIGAFEYGDNTTSAVNSDTDKDAKARNLPADANAGDDISICLGESITLNGAGGTTYKWDTGDTNKDISVNPKRTTTYELTAIRGGVTNTDTVTVTVENCNISSLKEDLDNNFTVYPNPATGVLNISINNNSDKEELNLTLTSINGSIVYSNKMSSNQSEILKQIDLSRLAKGIYFVRLFNSNQNRVKKVLII